ncbi:hypothetical protein FIM10_18600 [Sphingomonadales bacterium 56]|uniref:Bifunctional riboflavin kinase/FMN adenylyltransferase n=1 Tax=Sphingobium indicum TaxID=332055 RepID=A0A4Q4ITQ2_9SPHN|nr:MULTISPECIES: hypothetical protein [Sphingobium]MBY2930693.1 hypothetical protein [Sphingomonadales bacterium 56]MBY2960765.1 hypothetical protein [Sphingomonadales bacterium 58]NYI24997.1 hypothetical protein [Sphingobium indicum]RYL96727.1 hypothetical protein EWH08_19600 [Sphingobium indicum]CAD7341771.1 hypothetical protein SPHS6_03744 [Sphingobium sp. S6]
MFVPFPLAANLRGAVAALGNFDGVHRGHQAVVGHAVNLARARGVPAIAITFAPHPVRYFNKALPPFLLSDVYQRLALLRAAGADEAVALPFDGAMASLTPGEFIRHWLVDMLGVSTIVTGADFRFGIGRSGTLDLLRDEGQRLGFTCEALAIRKDAAEPISSTRIRECVRSGDLEEAEHLLGRPYRLAGSLIHLADGDLTLYAGDCLVPGAGRYRARIQAMGVTPVMVDVAISGGHIRCLMRGSDHAALGALKDGARVTLDFEQSTSLSLVGQAPAHALAGLRRGDSEAARLLPA